MGFKSAKLPFPGPVLDAVQWWTDKDFAGDVTMSDVEAYRKMVLDYTNYGQDGTPEDYGYFFPDL